MKLFSHCGTSFRMSISFPSFNQFLGIPILLTFWPRGAIPTHSQMLKKINWKMMQNIMCGMSLTCGKIVPIKSLGFVFPNNSINLIYNFFMNLLVGDNSYLTELWEKFLNVVYVGQQWYTITTCFVKVMNNTKGQGIFLKWINCQKIWSLSVKFLTYGG